MVASAKEEVARMARYHGWATQRLTEAVAAVPDAAYRKECGLFFGSIHGTLNHLLLTDGEIWYSRFTGGPVTGLPLDGELETDRALLASRLIAAAARWPAYVADLDDTALGGELHFITTAGQTRTLPMAAALLHVFNHATHHRGQVTAALSMLGVPYPSLDLAFHIFAERS
ncbi:MAG TPA: DinB family protein [Sphingobium sp.]|nr:DinB family protein [Sphingobium sp.]